MENTERPAGTHREPSFWTTTTRRAWTRARRTAAPHARTARALAVRHLLDTTPPPGDDQPTSTLVKHVTPRHAAMAVTATTLTIVAAASLYWWTSPTSSHQVNADVAVTDLRLYEKALDGDVNAATARDRIKNRYTVRSTTTETVVGRRSSQTGTCWVLRIPSNTNISTRITEGATTDCTAQPDHTNSPTTPGPAPTGTTGPPAPLASLPS
jgi:hypothetical protein